MMADADAMRAERDAQRKLQKQSKCRHRDTYESSVTTREGTYTNGFCWDCGKGWRSHFPAARSDELARVG